MPSKVRAWDLPTRRSATIVASLAGYDHLRRGGVGYDEARG
jgi:hypothetical protein